MSKIDQALRLLIIGQQLEQAEFLISHIRNGGIAVRPERVEDVDALETLIEQSGIDMILGDIDDGVLPAAVVAEAIKKHGKDIPLIGVVGQLDTETALAALASGMHDLVIRDQPKHIQFIIGRQFKALLNRRSLRHIESDLRESERRCDGLIESSRDPIAYIHDGMHIRANESYLQMFGFPDFDALEGMPILDLISSEQQGGFKKIIKDFSKTKQCPESITVTVNPENGEASEVLFEMMPASYDGELCMQLVARPQLGDSRLNEQLQELKDRDPNTMLYNRKYFMARLEEAVDQASAGRGHQAMLLLAPDQFEQRLRTLGMEQADALLQTFAERLKSAVGNQGLCCHFRDQTLAVICSDSAFEQTQTLAESLHRAFDNIVLDIGSHSVSFSVSIAAVQIAEQNASVPDVLNTAARLLLSMEGLGGNRFEVSDPNAGERADAELDKAWKDRLQGAIADGAFTLKYQPIINLMQEDDIHSYELLIRLPSPDDGESVSPEHFLPIAQSHGLIADIDRWVVKKAIELLAQRKKAGIDTQIFVKISPDSIQDGSLLGLLESELEVQAVEGQRLILQIPESKIITRLKDVQQFKTGLKPLGVRFGLSQFGTSVDSLKMLDHIDPDMIKIDRSFIEDLDKNPQHQARIREFVQRAHDQGKSTVAEFVSDANTMGFLFGAGVEWVQGNFLSPPLAQMNFDFAG